MRILNITSGVNLHRRCPGGKGELLITASQNGGLEVKREGVLVAEPDTKTKRPPFYRVIMLNDDYTPMEFVVLILKNLFHKTHEDAVHIMLNIHHHGTGLCGLFTRDVAETKVDQVIQHARQNEHPLQCIMERE